MPNKTEGVKILVQDVLAAEFSEPYAEDVIRDVCFAIEENHEWRNRYEQLKNELTRNVVNKWIGNYIKATTKLNSLRTVYIEEGHIITAYTKLGQSGRR